jgi:hypothetical protein
MKKIIFPLLALSLIAGSSCQETIDIEKEKKAIIAVIENEVYSFNTRDFDQQMNSLLQGESQTLLWANKFNYGYVVGWEEVDSTYKRNYERNPVPSTNKSQFTNYKIKVYQESAWAVYNLNVHNSEDEFLYKNIAIRFLEKVDGDWKIAVIGYINTTSYEIELEEGE